MCEWVQVKRLDGTDDIATNAGELAELLGCGIQHLIGPLKMDNCFRYGNECLCHLDVQETANRFRYRVDFATVGIVGAVMIERELWQ